jgi:preprotein translocase SecE subunit
MSKEPKAPAPKGGVPMPKMNRGIKGFYRDVLREMKHVNWPTPMESTRMTGIVLAVCIGLVLLLFGLSLMFEAIINAIMRGF